MLDFDLSTTLLEIANFLLLTFVLYHFLFRSVMKQVEERAQKKAAAEKQIAENLAESARLRAELEERLAKIEEAADSIVQNAGEKIEAKRQEMLDDVMKRTQRILEETSAKVKTLQELEIHQFYENVLDVVFTTSAELIARSAPQEVHDVLVKQLYRRIWELGQSDIHAVETLRRSLGERLPTVFAETARSLSLEQKKELTHTFTALADREVEIEVKIDASLASGMRVRLGDIVVDGTIADHLRVLREQVDKTIQERLKYAT